MFGLFIDMWYFIEVELEEMDFVGDLIVVKLIIELFCLDEWLEWWLEVIGWVVKGGIL